MRNRSNIREIPYCNVHRTSSSPTSRIDRRRSSAAAERATRSRLAYALYQAGNDDGRRATGEGCSTRADLVAPSGITGPKARAHRPGVRSTFVRPARLLTARRARVHRTLFLGPLRTFSNLLQPGYTRARLVGQPVSRAPHCRKIVRVVDTRLPTLFFFASVRLLRRARCRDVAIASLHSFRRESSSVAVRIGRISEFNSKRSIIFRRHVSSFLTYRWSAKT